MNNPDDLEGVPEWLNPHTLITPVVYFAAAWMLGVPFWKCLAIWTGVSLAGAFNAGRGTLSRIAVVLMLLMTAVWAGVLPSVERWPDKVIVSLPHPPA